jgi:hypothetical protein
VSIYLTLQATCALVTADLYLDQRGRVWLVDLNPFGAPTCPLFFDWDELIAVFAEDQEVLTRVVESAEQALQSTAGSARGPVDVHLAEDFPKFLEICKQQQQEPELDDSDGGGV